MLLTAGEYRRGIVRWSADTDATTAIVTEIGGREVASGRMTNPAGSVPDIEVTGIFRFDMLADIPTVPLGYWRISWDRYSQGEIRTMLLGGQVGEAMLAGIPALGRFERLILSVPYLQWGEGWVVRVGDVVVRFTDVVQFEGFQTESVEHRGRESTFIETFSTQRREGSFIEVVAPEAIEDRPEIALAIVGLLALVFGDVAIGDVVHRDVMVSTPLGTEYAVTMPQYAIPSAPNLALRMPIEPPREWLEDFDHLFSRFIKDTDVLTDTALPLRWYEQAIRTGSDVDRFLAAFVGLEALIGALGRRLPTESPIAELLRDARVPALLSPLRADYPNEHVDRLIQRLQDRNLSLRDRFDVVAASLGLTEDQRTIFVRANTARQPLVHGRSGAVEVDRATEAVELLRAMLRAALNRPRA